MKAETISLHGTGDGKERSGEGGERNGANSETRAPSASQRNAEKLLNACTIYVNTIILMAQRRAMSELLSNSINYTEPEAPKPLVIVIPTNFNTASQDQRDIEAGSVGLTTGKHHSPLRQALVPEGPGSFLSVDIERANSTSRMFEKSNSVSLLNSINRRLSIQRAKQDALFTRAHDRTNSFEVQAAFILHRKNPLDETDGMRLFALLDTANKGTITMEEILHETSRSATSEAHDLIWRYCDTPLAHLRNKKALAMLFGSLRTQPDGSLGMDEWKDFLALRMLHDHSYLRQKGLATGRAFYGRGRGAPCEDLVVQSNEHELVWGMFDPAWLADFWYYQRNHHPLLGLFLTDSDNPLTRNARLKIEFAVYSWNLFFSTLVFQIAHTRAKVYLLSLALVTVPVMIIRAILLYMFTCPCLHIRNSHPRHCQRKCLSCCRNTGHSLGTFYVVCGVAFLVLGILSAIRAGAGFVNGWLYSWALSYVLCVCVDLCTKFNTLRLFVYFRQSCISYACLGAVQCCGLAQWQIEKNTVLCTMSGEHSISATSVNSDLMGNNSTKSNNTSGTSSKGSRKWSYHYKGYTKAQVLPV